MSQFDSLRLTGLSHIIVLGKRSDFARLPRRALILDRSELANTLSPFTSPNATDLPRLRQFYRRISLSTQMPEGRDFADLLAAALLSGGYCGAKVRKYVEGPSLPVEMAGEIKPIDATTFHNASPEDKYARVLEMVPQYLPGEMKGAFAELVSPEAIGITVAILVVWAGSHTFGVGFAIDVLLLAIGFAMVGWSIFGAVGDVLEFFEIMESARGDADLNRAARKLASAIAALGVGTFIAILTRGAGRITAARKANVPAKQGAGAAASESQIAKYKPKTEDSKPRKTRSKSKIEDNTTGTTKEYEKGTKIDNVPEGRDGRQFWKKSSEFDGTRVFQRDDIIDPKLMDARGRTNLQRMQSGLAPIGPDGKSVNLHHMTQNNDSSLAEMSQTFHQKNSKVIHINPNTTGSGIDRPAFDKYRKSYWKNRSNDFSP